MAITSGTRLGPYEIAALIGRGGMGEVYSATDTSLKRRVAIKVLPEAVASDAQRLARFQREAEVLASLNHPNIAIVHGLEQSDGVTALVMELVEGPTLADRIAQGPIPLEEALAIAGQIAEALEAAHEQGVIHRDLKPANIKVRDDGTVKVLDFGLAKAMEPAMGSASRDRSQSPTITSPAVTQAGLILGTAAYMSPEQARGKPVDRRADIWAFGAVLYEMLAGKRAFAGDDTSETLARVIDRAPDWAALPANVPPVLARFLRRCLDKDPRRRVRDIGDVSLAIGGAFDDGRPARDGVVRPPAWQRPSTWAVGAAVVALGASLLGWSLGRSGARDLGRVVHWSQNLPPSDGLPALASRLLAPIPLALSPDGQVLVYAAVRDGVQQLFRRPMDQDQHGATPIPGTEGASFPFFSPEGTSLGFAVGSTLKRVAVEGGKALVLTEAATPITGASWREDNTIVFSLLTYGSVLWRVSASGGEAQEFTTLDTERGDLVHRGPENLPRGRGLLYSTVDRVILRSESGAETVLTEGSFPRYVETGHVVFSRGGSLWAAPFDLDALTTTGEPVLLVDGVLGPVTMARNGTLAYVVGQRPGVELMWVGRDGREEVIAEAGARLYGDVELSPDGQRIALTVDSDTTFASDLFVYDLARRTLTQVTTDAGIDVYPLWTPDGRHLVFSSSRSGTGRSLYRRAADGTGPVEPLTTSLSQQSPWGWSSDGTMLVVQEFSRDTGWDIFAVSTRESGAPVPLVRTEFSDVSAAISPNGAWIAFLSNQQVYVSPFPKAGESREQVSTTGGTVPRWSRDGRTLFYLAGSQVMSARVETEPRLSVGIPNVAAAGNYWQSPRKTWDVAPDGRFLLMREQVVPDPSIHVVLNWTRELSERVPVP